MSRALTTSEKVCRLALLERARVDMPHPTIRGARVIGYIVEADEFYEGSEGVRLLQALEQVAGVDFEELRANLLRLQDSPAAEH